ncbi:hypothetical protein [Amycolatopsis aidingensis]|uniref:hypothetical protein n=1 Tax=Amycolatopsis aidingensis TaxID=2842453 RepID=UPI001E64AA70|nr:hypothetical protein [Amycolatopsis aidingensis]
MVSMQSWRFGARLGAALSGALLLTAALPGAATALEPEDLPPIGADSGRFNLPISCAVSLGHEAGGLKLIDLPMNVDIQGVAPTQLRPGQDFYLTQGSGSMTFPRWLTDFGSLFGVNRADAVVTEMNIGAANANPEQRNIAEDPIEIKDIGLELGKELTVRLPVDPAATFPDIGPFTSPGAGVVTLQFNSAAVLIDLKPVWGGSIKVRADCEPVAGNALLSMAVGGPAGGPPLAFHDVPLNYPAVPVNNQAGIINAPYRCTVLGSRFDVGIAVGAFTPLSVSRNGSIRFTEASGALIIPAATVGELLDAGINTVSGRVRELNLIAEGGAPGRSNVLGDGFDFPETTLTRGQDLVVELPPDDGTLTAGPWRPVAGSGHVKITLGTAAAELSFNGQDPTSATCAAPDPEVILLDAPVTG